MEAKKGFLAILIILCACSCIGVGAAIAGWNAFGREIIAGAGSLMGSIETNTIEIERETLESYLLDNGIRCRRDDSTSVGDFESYVCDPSGVHADIHFRITYSKKHDKPFSILIGIQNLDEIAGHDDVVQLLETAVGIPYDGADAAQAGDWLNSCLDISGDYDELMVAKTIADVAFRISHSKRDGFTLSIMRNMAYEFEHSESVMRHRRTAGP